MTLYSIEKAIKPQLAWQAHPSKKLQSNEKSERFAGFGLMVFIGIANNHGIPKPDILDYICLTANEYETKSRNFDQEWAVIVARKAAGELCRQKDFTDRLYLKRKLTLRALRLQSNLNEPCVLEAKL